MIILVFSDVHDDREVVKRLKDEKADLVIFAGDAGSKEMVDLIAETLGERLLMVPGNNELPDWIPEEVSVHGRVVERNGLRIGGLGGSLKTPFGTIFEWDEDYARSVLSSLGSVDILVSHTPPAGTVLARTRSGEDIGSYAVREYIEENKPSLVITGHVHERGGISIALGKTVIVNPGKRGAILSPDGSVLFL